MCLKYFRKKPIIPANPGLLKSPQDFRDIPFSAVKKRFTPLPESYSIPYELDIKSQDNKPICVGCSGTLIKEFLERREGNFVNFSEDWLYKECKKIDNYSGEGTYFRIALKVLQKTGAMPY